MRDYETLFAENAVPPGSFLRCYVFSIHKCGSSLLHGMVDCACGLAGIPGISIPDLLFTEGYLNAMNFDPGLLDYFVDGRIYYGFREYPQVFKGYKDLMAGVKSVLLLRDPRDALVSQFFSYNAACASHALPRNNKASFLASLHARDGLSVDVYVLQAAKSLLYKLEVYKEYLDPETTLLLRYEDIYFDKLAGLKQVFSFFGISVCESVLQQAAAAFDIRPKKENQGKHIRKGVPGDHREKLLPATIDKLNAIFANIYASFGLQLD